MSRKHFHTFDALRFFAFLLVFLLHLPKTGNLYIDFFLKSGGIGVTFFFVLSGFLITYILLYEKEQKKKISLKKFFARRVLRIWPLFYLMIAFAYVSPYILNALNLPFTNTGYKPDLLTSIFFGENYKMMMTNTFPDGAPLRVMWSLCIEEHFYIFWAVILRFLSSKKIPHLIFASIIIAHISRLIYTHFGIAHIDLFSHLDYFAFGAIPAYILMHKKSALHYLEIIPKYLKYIFLIVTIAIVFIIPNSNVLFFDYFSPFILSLLFSITILFTLGKNALYISDSLWFSKLGKYTYGLYLYHTIIILALVYVFKYLSFSNWYVLAIVSLLITIGISILSYHVFEKQFLKLKRYFY
ncbi:acyltransferase [uncultured Polaribacter sp.]|uniref:acyltransferase family protein n=1 Tax=uncultured Polaribacter sp. TaxID=174711 RepID=UPI00260D8FFD|nr:acyltransferase [uncultured Polaribacter sp.]